jgi:hypothetical protein
VKRLTDQTLYEILEVAEDAAPGVIQDAWKRAHDIYGPGSLATYTLMSPDEAELLSRRIEEARMTLLDPNARARYDERLHQPDPARAATGGTPAPLASLPPVIPAFRPRPPEPPDDEGEEGEDEDGPRERAAPAPPTAAREEPVAAREEPPTASPAILLSAAVQATGPSPEPAPAPAPVSAPILLDREVAPAPPPLPAPPARAAEPARPATPPMPAVPDGAWTGDALRQTREARGLSVQQIADRTKVTRHHIENIEGERFGALPAPVYLRGILLSLARELRLDGQKVARAYLDRAAAATSQKPR